MALTAGLIEWKPAYNVNVAAIDSQHHVLVSLIRHLQEAMLQGRAKQVIAPLFNAMNQYMKFHFEYEEALLEEHNYPHLNLHREQHAALSARLQDMEMKYATGQLSAGAPLLQFLRSWLIDHVGEHDQKYAEFLRQKGVS
jgi:hemerythrin